MIAELVAVATGSLVVPGGTRVIGSIGGLVDARREDTHKGEV